MGGMRGFFEALKESRKKQVLFFGISMVLVIGIYLFTMRQLYERFEIIEDDFSWVYQVDSIEEIDGKLQINGWAFALNEDAKKENCEIILYDTKTGKGVYPKMTYESRDDVNEYFLCEYDYTESGFKANISTKKLQLENTVYEILLRPEGERKAFSTNVYYSDGEISYVHSDEFVPLEVVGTDLEKVVESGVLRAYRPEIGMYIYQYSGALYWITDSTYLLDGLGAWIQFHLNTTQIEYLPEERINNGWNWSNLSFYYQDRELREWNTGKYRISKYELPTEYSIYQIFTGRYDEDWIWRDDFRPMYMLQ